MADFLDEVEQDVNQENFYNLVKKLFPYFVAFSFMIVAATSYYVWNKAKKSEIQKLLSEDLMSANDLFQKNQFDEALGSYLNLLDKSNESYSAIAGLKAASLYHKQNKINEAISVYEKIMKNKAFDPLFRDQANLLRISYSYKKDGDNTKLLADLNQMISSDSPFKYNAMELKASILLDIGKLEEAEHFFNELRTSSSVPATIQRNSQAITSINWRNYE
jgi:hypothetical protein